MLTKPRSAVAVFGLFAVGLTLVASSTHLRRCPEKVPASELEEIQGLSQWRTIFGTLSCSQYNATAVNNTPLPNQPPGPIIPVDSCPAQGNCLECDGNATQFVGAVTGQPNGTGQTAVQSLGCGNLFFGRCQQDPSGFYTCNNNGQSFGLCGDATEFHVQPGTPVHGTPTPPPN
jgi:hypothetical protein